MRLTLAEPKFLVDSINVLSELVSDARFSIDKEKIELVAMDPANVVMVIFKLLGSAFTEYKVEKPVEIGVNLDNLKQILRRVKGADILILELDNEKNRLKIWLKGETNRLFNLSLIDIGEEKQKIPELKFPLRVETNAYVFDGAIEDVGVVAESVALIGKKDMLLVEAEGNLSDARVEISEDDDTKISNTTKGDIAAKYSIDYLRKIIKGGKLASNVVISFDKDYPLKVDYKVVDKLALTFILAPRVSSD